MRFLIWMFASFLGVGTCYSASLLDISGAEIVRINDPVTARCIDGSRDSVSFSLVKMVAQKDRYILSNVSSVGLYVDIMLAGATNGETKRVSFPQAFKINVQQYDSKLVNVPVEQSLLSRLALNTQGSNYTTAQFNIKYVNILKKSSLSEVIGVLSEITRDFPMPTNPFSEHYKQFTQLGNKIVERFSVNADASEIDPEAQITLEFSPNGTCSANHERTGAIAIIKDLENNFDQDVLKVKNLDEYCFYYNIGATKTLQYSKKVGNACGESKRTVKNPHILFVLNAVNIQASNELKRIEFFGVDRPPQGELYAGAPIDTLDSIAALTRYNDQFFTTGTDKKKFDSILAIQESLKKATKVENRSRDLQFEEIFKSFNVKEIGSNGSLRRTEVYMPGTDLTASDVLSAKGRCMAFGLPHQICN